MRWSLSGFEPTSDSRVAPDWELSDAQPTEILKKINLTEGCMLCAVFSNFFSCFKNITNFQTSQLHSVADKNVHLKKPTSLKKHTRYKTCRRYKIRSRYKNHTN